MLNLYFGNSKGALLSGNSYFDLNIDESYIETDFGRRIIKEISGADVLDTNSVKHIEVMPCPADDNHTRRDNWMKTEEGRKRANEEVINIINCVKNGLFPDFEI